MCVRVANNKATPRPVPTPPPLRPHADRAGRATRCPPVTWFSLRSVNSLKAGACVTVYRTAPGIWEGPRWPVDEGADEPPPRTGSEQSQGWLGSAAVSGHKVVVCHGSCRGTSLNVCVTLIGTKPTGAAPAAAPERAPQHERQGARQRVTVHGVRGDHDALTPAPCSQTTAQPAGRSGVLCTPASRSLDGSDRTDASGA